MLRYLYRITYFDICGARAIYPRFTTILLFYFDLILHIYTDTTYAVGNLSVIYGDACLAVPFL